MDNQLLYSKLLTKLGVVLVMFDGNTYTMLEMILLGLLTHNTMIFAYNGYMGGTNGLLINLIQTVLEKENLKKEIEKLENSWSNIQEKWTIIVVHSELDMVDLALNDFKTAIDSNNINDAYLKVRELEYLFSHIAERDSFKIKNIF